MTIETLFDLSHTLAADYLRRFSYPWEALEGLQTELRRLGETLGPDYRQIGPEVWVHETATVAPTAYIGGPCIIGAGTEVRHCAFIRGSALIGSELQGLKISYGMIDPGAVQAAVDHEPPVTQLQATAQRQHGIRIVFFARKNFAVCRNISQRIKIT